MKKHIPILFFISSMAHVVVSVAAPSADASDLEYCKVPYIDSASGDSGTYRGQCENGKPNGSGTVTFYNGNQLSGEFTQGILNGEGKFTAADGSIYSGQWENGQRHGQGKYTWARGSSYEGEWFDDKRHGKGIFVWSNGNRFEGEFRNNKRYNGMYYTTNGGVYRCQLGQCR